MLAKVQNNQKLSSYDIKLLIDNLRTENDSSAPKHYINAQNAEGKTPLHFLLEWVDTNIETKLAVIDSKRSVKVVYEYKRERYKLIFFKKQKKYESRSESSAVYKVRNNKGVQLKLVAGLK